MVGRVFDPTRRRVGSVALEVWGTLDGVLRNAAGDEETFAEGTILARFDVPMLPGTRK